MAKRIAIISNGPSAWMFSEANREDYDAIIGVNGRVAYFPCDWWCFVDFSTFVNITPLGHPKLFLSQNAIKKLHSFMPERVGELDDYELLVQDKITLPQFPDDMPKWNSFSGLPAPVLAWHLGAEEVHVFGADMNGTLDHDGLTSPSRHDKRWSHERDIWFQVTSTLLQLGVKVWRILP